MGECLKLKAQTTKLKAKHKQLREKLEVLSKVKEECGQFVAEMKARRTTKSRRRSWGTGVNTSVKPPQDVNTLDPRVQKWFPPLNETHRMDRNTPTKNDVAAKNETSSDAPPASGAAAADDDDDDVPSADY